MTKTEYAKYLAGDHWRTLRKEVIDAVGSICEECLMPRWLAEIAYDQDLHVHHLTYANLGNEQPEDLRVLCARCHEIETFGRSQLRALKSSQCELCAITHWDYRSVFCRACRDILYEPYIYHMTFRAYPFDNQGVETMGEHIRKQIASAEAVYAKWMLDIKTQSLREPF